MGYLVEPVIQLDDLLDLDKSIEIKLDKNPVGSKECCNDNCDC